MKNFTFTLYFSSLFSLLLYSFSQIDLNLTLSSNSIYQTFQNSLIQLGYFNRPLSTAVYLIILSGLFLSYLLLIHLARQKKLSTQDILRVSILTASILLLSYPAFSHDIFNYIFDSRILIHHQSNPYTHTALDFPDDLWTRFMRWTHRTYPYGPTWLPLTSIFYIIGSGKFTLTLLSFKLLGILSYLLTIFSLHKLLTNTKSKVTDVSLALFAFNPLIIIESLVSPHLDATMAAFMLLSFVLVLSKHKVLGFISLVISIGIKYISFAAAPLIYSYDRRSKPSTKHLNKYNIISIVLAYCLTIFVISQREILPWYFITPFSLTVLVPKQKLFITLMMALTAGLLLRYSPFIFIGEYTSQVDQARHLLMFLSLFTIFFICYLPKKIASK